MPLCLLIQWHDKSSSASVSVNWAALAVTAGILGCLSTEKSRQITLPLAVAVLLACLFNFFWITYPTLINSSWSADWGIISAFSPQVSWMVFVLFGTLCVLRYSPNVIKHLPAYLFGFHSVNLLFHILYTEGIYSQWFVRVAADINPGGLLPTMSAWSTMGAISIPILWSWRRWAILPALLPVFLIGSYSAVLALTIAFLWWAWKSGLFKRLWVLSFSITSLGLCAFSYKYQDGKMMELVSLKVYTWIASIKLILANPFGTGWHPIKPQHLQIQNYSSHDVLSHPASDFLKAIMENGWVAIPFVAWIFYWAYKKLSFQPIDLALITAGSLCLFHKTVSSSHVGLLIWAIWLIWKINDYKESVQ